jgi:hypothetical protein
MEMYWVHKTRLIHLRMNCSLCAKALENLPLKLIRPARVNLEVRIQVKNVR